MRLIYPPGATPLDPDEIEGLRPSLATQGELNEFEHRNIVEARRWALRSRRFCNTILTLHGLKRLHQSMFGHTWHWAGKLRRTEKNIGVAPEQISEQTLRLCDDARFWQENNTFSTVETAARFHHRLVWIHLFPNGNGRHARLATDVLMVASGYSPLSWGAEAVLTRPSDVRRRYIAALRAADAHDYQPLISFLDGSPSERSDESP